MQVNTKFGKCTQLIICYRIKVILPCTQIRLLNETHNIEQQCAQRAGE